MTGHIDYLKNNRRDFSLDVLLEENILTNPFELFDYWFGSAVDKQIVDANAMSLATVGRDNNPHVRIVLLREYNEKGFVFYTNYRSSKAQQIENNSNVCLHFFWKELVRQVRIQGVVSKVESSVSNRYFDTRPKENQLGAYASPQSQVIENRKVLENNYKKWENEFSGKTIVRPEHWGGYIVKPTEFEFWQGRESRLHDRFRYRLQKNNAWKIERLAP